MAQGHIRIRCKVCRKAGLNEKQCKAHKERVFQAIYPGADGRAISKTFKTLVDAQKWVRETGRELDLGIYRKIRPETVKEISEKLLLSVRVNCRPATISSYQWAFDKHIWPAFGDKYITNVSSRDISVLLASIETKSFSLRKHIITLLKATFKFAEEAGALKDNPTKNIKKIKRSLDEGRLVILTNKQCFDLINIADDPACRLFYKMAIFTGLRPNELCGLKKSDINLDKRQLTVNRTLYYFKTLKERGNHSEPYIFQAPKTKAGYRIVPLIDDLVKDIQIFLINSPENRHNLLFTAPGYAAGHGHTAKQAGEALHHQRDIIEKHFLRHIQTLHRRTEFPILDFYALRHTYCSNLAAMDIPIKKIQYLMGHSDFQTTFNIYAKIKPDDNTDIGQKLQSFVYDNARIPANEDRF